MIGAATGLGMLASAYAGRWDAAVIRSHAGAAGREIIGFLDTGFPEEIAIAAGLLPVLLTGDPNADCPATEGKVDLAIPGRARQLYEGLLTGRYAYLSALAITGGDRYLANTYGFMDAYRTQSGEASVATMYYIDRARGTYREHRDFNLQSLTKFRERLAAHVGRSVDEAALANAISLVNESRRLLQRLADVRAARPGVIAGTDAARIALAAMSMPKADFNAGLRSLLEHLPEEPLAADRPKVFLAGSAIDHVELHGAVEAAGAVVVSDSLEFSGRYAHELVREDMEPMEALADRYTFKFPDAWGFGRERRIAMQVKRASAAGADAVLYFHLQHDSPTGWDFPDLRDALAREGIPSTVIHDQPYRIADPGDFAARIGTVVAGLKK